MPTAHVRPNANAALQEIADALYKSRKVLVVTGAGISTNSGIPVCQTSGGHGETSG
jgi:NAD-dependent SIR2 family protein deacetylase